MSFWLLAGLGPVAAADFFAPATTNSSVSVVQVQGRDLMEAFLPYEDRVEQAFNTGLQVMTTATNVAAAWLSLVNTNDVVGIKVLSTPGPLSGTRPAVVAAVVNGLRAAGLPPDHIIIWDKHMADLRDAGYVALAQKFGVMALGAAEGGYDTNTFYLPDSPVIGSLVWGDTEFGQTNLGVGKKSFVAKLVAQRLTKIVSVAPLINELDAGLCGHFYSLSLGSVDNTRRFEGDSFRLGVALPEIYAQPAVGDKVVLCVTDALLAQDQGGPASFLQYSAVLQQLWFSRDPVALDTLGLKELDHQRRIQSAPKMPSNFQIYTNATLLQLGISDPSRILINKVAAP